MADITPDQIRDAVKQGVSEGLKGKTGNSTSPQGDSQKSSASSVGGAMASGANKGVDVSVSLTEKAFSNATPTITGFSGQLGALAGKIGGSGLGNAVASFGSVIDSNIGVFRNLSGTGIDLGNSLMEAQLAAGRARLPLDVFSKRVQENSFMLATMYGTASEGANKFAEVSGMVMDKAGKKLATLGFTMDEISGYTATYMEMLQRSGMSRQMSDAEVATGAAIYNQELDKLAKATGISRKALDEQNAAAARDLRMRNAMQALMEKDPTGKLAAEVQAEIARLKQADPSGKLAAGMVDSITAGGNAITKEAREYQLAMRRNGQDAAKITRDVYEGQANSTAGLRKANDDAAASAREKAKQDRNLVGIYSTMNTDNMITASARLGQLGNATEAMTKAQTEQAAKIKAGETDPTRRVADFDQTLTRVQNKFKEGFIDSGILDYTAKGLEKVGGMATKLADEFAETKTPGKLVALLGPAIGMAVAEGLKTGFAVYGAKKGIDAVTDKSPMSKTPEKTPGTPDADAPKGGLKKAAETAGKVALAAGKKVIILGGVAYVVNEVLDATGAKQLLIDSIKKPEGERPLSIEEERAKNAARVPDTLGPRTNTEVPKVESPVVQPAVLPEAQTAATNKAISDTKTNAQSLNDAVRNTDFSKLMLPENVTVSLENGNSKLRDLKTNIVSATTAFADLNNVNLDKLSENITRLNENMSKLATQVAKPFDVKSEGDKSAAAPIKTSESLLSDLATKLDQLNTTMMSVASSQTEAVDYLSKTAKNTRNAVGNMLA